MEVSVGRQVTEVRQQKTCGSCVGIWRRLLRDAWPTGVLLLGVLGPWLPELPQAWRAAQAVDPSGINGTRQQVCFAAP